MENTDEYDEEEDQEDSCRYESEDSEDFAERQ